MRCGRIVRAQSTALAVMLRFRYSPSRRRPPFGRRCPGGKCPPSPSGAQTTAPRTPFAPFSGADAPRRPSSPPRRRRRRHQFRVDSFPYDEHEVVVTMRSKAAEDPNSARKYVQFVPHPFDPTIGPRNPDDLTISHGVRAPRRSRWRAGSDSAPPRRRPVSDLSSRPPPPRALSPAAVGVRPVLREAPSGGAEARR